MSAAGEQPASAASSSGSTSAPTTEPFPYPPVYTSFVPYPRGATASSSSSSTSSSSLEDHEIDCAFSDRCWTLTFFIALLVIWLTVLIYGLVAGRRWEGLLFIIAILPGSLLLAAIFAFHTEKVTLGRMLQNAFWGVIGAIPVLLLELGLVYSITALSKMGGDEFAWKIATQFLTAFVVAGLIEETLKYFLIAVYPAYQGISHLFGIFILSAAGATGFAMLENVSYVLRALYATDLQRALSVSLVRSLLSSPFHVCTAVFIGNRVIDRVMGVHRRQRGASRCFIARTLWFPIVAHGVFDVLLLMSENPPTRNEDDAPTLKMVFFAFALMLDVAFFAFTFWSAWQSLLACNEFEAELRSGARAPLTNENRSDGDDEA